MDGKAAEEGGKDAGTVPATPRMIDIHKFYKESSSSGEERAKVLFRLNRVLR